MCAFYQKALEQLTSFRSFIPPLPLFPKALLLYPTLCPILTFKNLTYSLSCLAVSSLQLTLHMLRNWLVGIFPFDALNFTILLEL